MIQLDTFPGSQFEHNGKTYLYFGGTAYLGLQSLDEFQRCFSRHIAAIGTTFAASRLANVQLSVFEEGERWISKFCQSEDAMYLSSGFLAGQLVRKHFSYCEENLIFGPNTHSALLREKDVVSKNFQELHARITQVLQSSTAPPVVFMDTIDFSAERPLDLSLLTSLPLDKIILVADDSHGFGVCGKGGRGNFSNLEHLEPRELIVCGSLGKGYGVPGGIILGRRDRIDNLRKDPWYGGGSPGCTASLPTLRDCAKLIEQRNDQLMENVTFFANHCRELPRFYYSKNYPCFTVQDEGLASFLESVNILITNFRYPDSNAPLLCRIVISASHTKQQINVLLESIHEYYGKK